MLGTWMSQGVGALPSPTFQGTGGDDDIIIMMKTELHLFVLSCVCWYRL